MKITLREMEIKNFKGIKDYNISFNNENAYVYGDNATGKSTLQDAFIWCIFGKDASDASDTKFSIRPIDPKTLEPIHYIDIKVNVTLEIDGIVKTFSKTKKEKWTKKRGSQEQVFSGNENILEIDDVPVNTKDWQSAIDTFGGEDLFKMVTNVLYFNQMEWSKARDIIFKLVPDLTDADVFASNQDLRPLQVLSNETQHPVEDLYKIAKSKIAKLNVEIKELPARIDELSSIDYREEKNFNINEYNITLKQLKDKLAQLNNGDNSSFNMNKINDINKKILDLDSKLDDARSKLRAYNLEYQEKCDKAKQEFNIKKQELSKKISEIETNGHNNSAIIGNTVNEIKQKKEAKGQLLEAYKNIKARIFNATNCSLCGQRLPEDQLEKALENFNALKAKDLEENITLGKQTNVDINHLENNLEVAKVKELEFRESFVAVKKEINALKEEKVEYLPEANSQENMLKLQDQINELINKRNKLQEDDASEPNEKNAEKKAVEAKIEQLIKDKTSFELNTENQDKIKKLQLSLKEKIKDQEQQIRVADLCNQFLVDKSNLITYKVNDNFCMVNFKLFETQINGGINPTCVATVNGVPFADLNTAMKIKAGLDIINALNRVNNIVAPIWIDNSESVNWELAKVNTNAQIIRMFKVDNLRPMVYYQFEKKFNSKGEIE